MDTIAVNPELEAKFTSFMKVFENDFAKRYKLFGITFAFLLISIIGIVVYGLTQHVVTERIITNCFIVFFMSLFVSFVFMPERGTLYLEAFSQLTPDERLFILEKLYKDIATRNSISPDMLDIAVKDSPESKLLVRVIYENMIAENAFGSSALLRIRAAKALA